MKVELHCHTLVSKDSLMRYDEIIRRVKETGLDAIAITDHNKIDGAQELAKRAPFPVIIGEEIRTSEGEIIGYFLREWIPPRLTPEETIRRIRAQGGIVNIPHPFDSLRRSVITRKALYRVADQTDMLEAMNGRVIKTVENEYALKFAQHIGKPAVCGSDAHIPSEVGHNVTELDSVADPAAFLASLPTATCHGAESAVWVHFGSTYAKWVKRLTGRYEQ